MLDASKSFVDSGVTPVAWETLFNVSHKTRYLFIVNGTRYTEDDIRGNPVLERALMLEPCIGRCCTTTLTVTLTPKSDIPKAAPVLAYCRLTNQDGTKVTAWYPLGEFWITKRSRKSELLELTVRDSMIKANQTYLDKTKFIEWPVKVIPVLKEIASLMDVELDPRNVIHDVDTVDYPNEDAPMSEVLSAIAAAQGGIFIMSPDNKLRLVPFPDDRTAAVQDIDTRYSSYKPLSVGTKTVSRITLNDIAGNQFTYGDDSGIEIAADCDYATDAITCRVATGLMYENGTIHAQNGVYDHGTVSFESIGLLGMTHRPYELTGAYIDPRVELGDVISLTYKGEKVKCVCGEIRTSCSQYFVSNLSFGTKEDDEEEFPYVSASERQANRYISTTKAYFGNRINRKDGFVSEYVKNDEVVARFTANANLFSMQQKVGNSWKDRIYFDPVAGKYKITGEVEIAGRVTFEDLATRGKTTIHGDNITTGTLNTNQVKIAGSDNFMWNEDYIVAKNPANTNQQIRYGKYNGSDMGIAFTTDGGKTWQSAIGFNGVVLRAGSITPNMLSSDIKLNPISDSETAPTSAADGDLWIDTSVTPPVLKRYNSTSKTWVAVNQTDMTSYEARLKAAEQKITDSAIISTVTSSSTFVQLQNTANGAKSTAESAQSTANSAKSAADSAASTVAGYETRLSTAEQKITDSAIISTVTSSSTYTNALNGKVSTNQVISCINQTAESVKIKANKIEFDGAVITNGTLTTGNWRFDSSGSNYANGNITVNMQVLSGSFVGGGTSTRAFYSSSNCDVQYGADYGYTTFIRSKEITIVAHNNSDMNDYRMATFSKYPGPKDYEDFTFYCNDSDSDSPAGNLGYAEQPWDTIYVNSCFRLREATFSSKHVKHDILDLPDMGDLLDKLRPVSFKYNYKHSQDQIRYGLILEEAVNVLPSICTVPDYEEGSDEYLSEASISYSDLIAPMLKEIQLLRARVKKLEESAA